MPLSFCLIPDVIKTKGTNLENEFHKHDNCNFKRGL